MSIWQNNSPRAPRFNAVNMNALTPYIHRPDFAQTTGVFPGQTPMVHAAISPPLPANDKQARLASLKSTVQDYFKISHG